ncbi:uncharacterized protein MYCFIDRAFT_210787, partial [Pseudocercospora fijiensis CIRAD86]
MQDIREEGGEWAAERAFRACDPCVISTLRCDISRSSRCRTASLGSASRLIIVFVVARLRLCKAEAWPVAAAIRFVSQRVSCVRCFRARASTRHGHVVLILLGSYSGHQGSDYMNKSACQMQWSWNCSPNML